LSYEVKDDSTTYNSRLDSFVDTLEGQHTIAQVLVVSFFIEKGTADGNELAAGPFPKDMIKEAFAIVSYHPGNNQRENMQRHILRASATFSL
jgi:hypothetical protein